MSRDRLGWKLTAAGSLVWLILVFIEMFIRPNTLIKVEGDFWGSVLVVFGVTIVALTLLVVSLVQLVRRRPS